MSNMVRLDSVASIAISNVDKKTKESQKQVVLCNFVDVYHNWAITRDESDGLMKSSASDKQINDFLLQKGDVAITKDSETRDDIGISTYIADEIKDMVLGYHCALIRPKTKTITGKYLNAFFNTKTSRKHFENNASGSGQRYTLSQESIGSLKIPLVSIKTQNLIGDFLSDIDKRIRNNTHIYMELEAMAKLVYDYWFLQFEFPNEEGKPYKSSGGRMEWSKELKREIPVGWHCKTIEEIAKIDCSTITPENDCKYNHYSIPAFDDMHIPAIEYGTEIDSGKYLVPDNSVLVSKLNPHFKRIWLVENPPDNAICSTEFMPFVSTNNTLEFLYETLNSDAFYTYMVNSSSSSTGSRKRMQPELCTVFKIPYPDKDNIIIEYCKRMSSILNKSIDTHKENQELSALRDFALPLLMNGQIRFQHSD